MRKQLVNMVILCNVLTGMVSINRNVIQLSFFAAALYLPDLHKKTFYTSNRMGLKSAWVLNHAKQRGSSIEIHYIIILRNVLHRNNGKCVQR